MRQQAVITECGTYSSPIHKRKSIECRLLLIYVRMTPFIMDRLTCFNWDIQFWFSSVPSLDTVVFLANSVIQKVSSRKSKLICYKRVKISFKTQRQMVRPIESPYYRQRDPGRFLLLFCCWPGWSTSSKFIRERMETDCSHFSTNGFSAIFSCFPFSWQSLVILFPCLLPFVIFLSNFESYLFLDSVTCGDKLYKSLFLI